MKVGSTVAAKAGADAPGGGISLCFCRRGCAAPAQSRHAQPRSTTLRSYCKKIETNLSEDILVSVYYVRWFCVRNLLIVRTGGLPPNLRSGRLRPERQVLQERLALQVLQERPCLQELRLELQGRQQQGLRRRPEQ